jgi:hypothetical protein
MEEDFHKWQNETVFFKKHGETSIKYLLHRFIDELILFIKKNGYNICVSRQVFANTIVSLLYKLDKNRFYKFPIPNNIKYDDSYEHFDHSIDWEIFWKDWNNMTFNFFEEAEIHILHVVWAYIDLDKSDAHALYVQSMEDSDSEDETPKVLKNMDPYLLDQLNASNHYKFTRFDNA